MAGGKNLVPYSVGGDLETVLKKAISQLIKITIKSGALLNFKCPYHAKVIKIFEMVSKIIVFMFR